MIRYVVEQVEEVDGRVWVLTRVDYFAGTTAARFYRVRVVSPENRY